MAKAKKKTTTVAKPLKYRLDDRRLSRPSGTGRCFLDIAIDDDDGFVGGGRGGSESASRKSIRNRRGEDSYPAPFGD